MEHVGQKFFAPVKVKNWCVLKIGAATLTKTQVEGLKKALVTYGLGNQSPCAREFHAKLAETNEDTDKSIEDEIRKISKDKDNIQIALVVLSSCNTVIYNRVKFWSDIKAGMCS